MEKNCLELHDIKLSDEGLRTRAFRNVFIVENRNFWKNCPFSYDAKSDLVLTLDFGVFKQINMLEGNVAFLDHFVDKDTMENYNYDIYDFLSSWYKDKDGNDIFKYKDIGFGNAFRLEIWNDATYYCRIQLNLIALKSVNFGRIYVGTSDFVTLRFIKEMDFKVSYWKQRKVYYNNYYFPVFRWMRERIYPSFLSSKYIIRLFVSAILDFSNNLIDFFFKHTNKDKFVFALKYFPTEMIIEQLKFDHRVRVISTNYSWSNTFYKERRLQIKGLFVNYSKPASVILKNFEKNKTKKMMIGGVDLGEILFEVFLKKISRSLPDYLKITDSILKFFKNKDLRLMITYSNIGAVNCLMSYYCNQNNIPIYLIINGFLVNAYLDEAKNATWINSYGESIKNNYFSGMNNVICLGDPRMDVYINSKKNRHVDRVLPTVAIGAAGFSNIDLNSYLAYEFDFLNDVLYACLRVIETGKKMNLILKVRSNGYLFQYNDFIQEYYPELPIKVFDSIPMKDLLNETDFYISIYSQTLFEASCLGIPVLYYKKDTEHMYPPFDGKSELVTAKNTEELLLMIKSFYDNSDIYNKFNERSVMEKYIGPLDGNNLKRNMDFIYSKV